jgi:hypothetical protein
VNLCVLVNTKLHLEKVAELELLWSVCLRVFLRVLILIVFLFFGDLIFLYLLTISTGGAVSLASAAEDRSSF